MKLPRQHLRTGWIVTASVVSAWLWMMIVHETGHVIFAWMTGGTVERVWIPLAGISWTQLSTNPNPVAVAWGGFIVGSLLPVAVWGTVAALRLRIEPGLRFFASFCLLANGAYMASALGYPVGDVEDILAFGGARWPLMLAGPIAVVSGLAVLGQAGPRGLIARAHRAGTAGACWAGAALAAAVVLARVFSTV